MKKIIFLTLTAFFAFTNCGKKESMTEDVAVETEITEDGTPAQYEGSTGVEEAGDAYDANENIELKKQEFNGSFSTSKTQTYTFTVLNEKEYNFSLESKNPDIEYFITNEKSDIIVPATSNDTKITLSPGKYTITGSIEPGEGKEITPETEFLVKIQ